MPASSAFPPAASPRERVRCSTHEFPAATGPSGRRNCPCLRKACRSICGRIAATPPGRATERTLPRLSIVKAVGLAKRALSPSSPGASFVTVSPWMIRAPFASASMRTLSAPLSFTELNRSKEVSISAAPRASTSLTVVR